MTRGKVKSWIGFVVLIALTVLVIFFIFQLDKGMPNPGSKKAEKTTYQLRQEAKERAIKAAEE